MFKPTFDQVIGESQNKILKGLKDAVDSNEVIQKILLIGPSGSGKTTIAQLYAQMLSSALYEVNCSSDTGIAAMKDVIERLPNIPINSRFNVVFLDEIQGLSNPAQQALLTPLDSLTPRTIVIAATTDARKVLSSLKSRFSTYNIGSPTNKEISNLVLKVLCDSGISIPGATIQPDKVEKEIPSNLVREAILQSEGNVRSVFQYVDQIVNGTYTSGKEIEDEDNFIGSYMIHRYGKVDEAIKIAFEIENYYGEAIRVCHYALAVIKNNSVNDRKGVLAKNVLLNFNGVQDKVGFFVALLNFYGQGN